MRIRIRSWDKYNPKRDQNTYTWFRCSNEIFSGSDFCEYDTTEIAIWLSIISEASKKNADTIDLKIKFLSQCGRCDEQKVRATIEKLISECYIEIVATATATAAFEAGGSEHQESTTPTDERTNGTNERTDERGDTSLTPPAITPEKIKDLYDKKFHGVGNMVMTPGFFLPPALVQDFQKLMGFKEFHLIEYWEKYFDEVLLSEWMTEDFCPPLGWLLKAENAHKVLSQFYRQMKSKSDKTSKKRMAPTAAELKAIDKEHDDYVNKNPDRKFKLELTQ